MTASLGIQGRRRVKQNQKIEGRSWSKESKSHEVSRPSEKGKTAKWYALMYSCTKNTVEKNGEKTWSTRTNVLKPETARLDSLGQPDSTKEVSLSLKSSIKNVGMLQKNAGKNFHDKTVAVEDVKGTSTNVRSFVAELYMGTTLKKQVKSENSGGKGKRRLREELRK